MPWRAASVRYPERSPVRRERGGGQAGHPASLFQDGVDALALECGRSETPEAVDRPEHRTRLDPSERQPLLQDHHRPSDDADAFVRFRACRLRTPKPDFERGQGGAVGGPDGITINQIRDPQSRPPRTAGGRPRRTR